MTCRLIGISSEGLEFKIRNSNCTSCCPGEGSGLFLFIFSWDCWGYPEFNLFFFWLLAFQCTVFVILFSLWVTGHHLFFFLVSSTRAHKFFQCTSKIVIYVYICFLSLCFLSPSLLYIRNIVYWWLGWHWTGWWFHCKVKSRVKQIKNKRQIDNCLRFLHWFAQI